MNEQDALTVRAILRDEMSRPLQAIGAELGALDRKVDQLNAKQAKGATAAARANDAHRKSVQNLSNSYARLATQISSASSAANHLIASTGKGLAVASATGFGALLGWGIKTTSQIQQTNIALQTFVGDTMAKKLFGELRKLDKMSPFTFPELAATTTQLSAFGVEASKVGKLTASISEIASGSGKGAAGLQQLSLAVAQVSSAGRLSGDEARQLSEFFNVYEVAGKLYGKTAAEMKQAVGNGAVVPANVILDAIANQTGDLERFRGLNEKQLNTIAGQWASFRSDMQIIAAGDPTQGIAGAFDPLVQGLKSELPILTQDLGDSLKEIGPSLSNLAVSAARFAEAFIPLATPVFVRLFDALGRGLEKATPGIWAMSDGDFVEKWGQFADGAEQLVPAIIDLGKAAGPLIADLAKLAGTVLPFLVGGFSRFLGVLADLSQSSTAGAFAVTALVSAFLGFRLLTGVAGTIQAITLAIQALTAAQAANAGVRGAGFLGGAKGLLGKLGLAGAAGYGIYEGATQPAGSGGSALGFIGGGAAAGALFGSAVPVVGTGIGALAGGLTGAGLYAGRALFGDLPHTMAKHSAVESMTPGNRNITSSIRNWGLASNQSGHLTGDAIDVHGSFMNTYAQNVNKAGGWARLHDAGRGTHVHAEFGDVMSAGRGGISSSGGQMMINVGPIYANTQIDFETGVRRALASIDRERERRGA